MWRRSVYLKTLHDYRIAILGWGIGMGLVVVSPMASVATLISTPQQREELARLATSFTWNADPIALTTVGGYTTWKIGTFILLIAIWPLLAASRMLRGEEEQGRLDALLSLPVSRTRVAVDKVLALWTALLAMGLLIGLITFIGGRRFGADFGFGDGLLFGINLALICAVVGSVALLISQFTRERSRAAGITGGLLLVFIVLDMVHRVFPDSGWISRLSPVYYYNLSKPLIPSYGANAAAMLLLLVLAAALDGVAIRLFVRRDVGRTVPLPLRLPVPGRSEGPAGALPADAWSLRTVFTRSVRMIAWPTAWWTLGTAGFAAWIVVVVGQIESQLSSLLGQSSVAKTLIKNLGGSSALVTEGFLSAMFMLLPLFLMAFAVTQVNQWSADEQEGRLELVLATPQPRLRVLLARFAALGLATLVISLITFLATAAATAAAGLSLDAGNLLAATLGMVPLALLVAAVGYLGAGWLRTAADTGLLSFLLLAWFFISFIGPELSLPHATQRLSAFYYYGTPLLHGLQVASIAGVLAVSLVALGLGAARFVRKDIGV